MVIGGAGSIGQAVTREIFKRNPLVLHVDDISENNMVELMKTFEAHLAILMAILEPLLLLTSNEYEALMRSFGGYDYVLNLLH